MDEISQSIYNYLSTLVPLALGMLYFFAVLHKSNYDFFDPYISCSADFFSKILEDYHLTSIGFVNNFHSENYVFLRRFSIYFAFLSELIIPLLLFTKKYKNYGIAYGIIFHMILALYFHGGIYSFSAMVYSYYVFFFDFKTVNYLSNIFNKGKTKSIFIASILFLVITYILIPTQPDSLFFRSTTKLFSIGILFFMIFAFILLLLFVKVFKMNIKNNGTNYRLKYYFSVPSLLILLFFFLNGLCPYLGLKTEVTFSMFSNLRTEGNLNNHIFMPKSLRVFSFLDEPIIIKNTDIDFLSFYKGDSTRRIVPFQLNKVLKSTKEDFFIDYYHNNKLNKLEKINGALVGDSLNVYSNVFLEYMMTFRPVLTNNECQH